MARIVYLTLVVVALVLLATGGWIVQGARAFAGAARTRRPVRPAAPAPTA